MTYDVIKDLVEALTHEHRLELARGAIVGFEEQPDGRMHTCRVCVVLGFNSDYASKVLLDWHHCTDLDEMPEKIRWAMQEARNMVIYAAAREVLSSQ